MNELSTATELATRARFAFDRMAIALAAVVWTVLVVGAMFGQVGLPYPNLLVLAVPAAFGAAWILFSESLAPELRLATACTAVVALAYFLVPHALANPPIAYGAPFALAAGVAVTRYPAAGLIALLVLSAVNGSIRAFLGFSPLPLVDLLLAGLALSVLVHYVVRDRDHGFEPWPAALAVIAYAVVTFVQLFTVGDPALASIGFHTSTWLMLSFLVVAYSGWRLPTLVTVGQGFVIVAVAVGGYATLRWLIGPAQAEADLARYVAAGINIIGGELRTVGSFLTGHQLAMWTGIMAPFCLALGLAWRGHWRTAALAGTALCVFGLFASQARAALVGMVLGMILVVVLFAMARSFATRVGTLITAVMAALVLGGGALALTATSDEGLDRYARILDPGSDPAWEQREGKWSLAMPEIGEHPFGQGLGSGGGAQQQAGQFVTVASRNLDSSYLKIAWEQGLPAMILFVVAFLGLLLTLARRAIQTTERDAAMLAIGACGALTSMLVLFYSGLYIEALPVLAGWLVLGLGTAALFAAARRDRAGA